MDVGSLKQKVNFNPNEECIIYITAKVSGSHRRIFNRFCMKNGIPKINRTSKYISKGGIYFFNLINRWFSYPSQKLIKILRRWACEENSINIKFILVSWQPETKEWLYHNLIQSQSIVESPGNDGDVHIIFKTIIRKLTTSGVLNKDDWKLRYADMGKQKKVIDLLINSEDVLSAIKIYEEENNVKDGKSLARKHARQLVPNRSYFLGTIMGRITRKFLKKHFQNILTKGLHHIQNLPPDCDIIYLPTHRSHMDFIILPIVAFDNQLPVPYFISSNHLNFWPINRTGACFIYRKAKDIIYNCLLKKSLSHILSMNHSSVLFIEGTRSKDGKPKSPKSGILSQLVNHYIVNPGRNLAFIPLYIGYDKVGESETFLGCTIADREKSKQLTKEELDEWFQKKLHKKKNLKTKLRGFYRRWKAPSISNAYINVGEPVMLKQHLDKHVPDWRSLKKSSPNFIPPEWQREFTKTFSRTMMRRIHSQTEITPTSLVCEILNNLPDRRIYEVELVTLVGKLLKLLKAMPYTPTLCFPEMDHLNIVDTVKKFPFINRERRSQNLNIPAGVDRRKQQVDDNIIYLTALDLARTAVYKNNILHLTVIPSQLINLIAKNPSLNSNQIFKNINTEIAESIKLYSIPVAEPDLEKFINKSLNALVESNFIYEEDQKFFIVNKDEVISSGILSVR